MEKTTVRLCLECGKPLKKAKRSDTKFCDDECRNDYFNARKNEESGEIKKIQNTLKLNRRILKQLLGKNDHVISKTKGNEFIFSFNYGYHAIDGNQYKIVKSFK